MELRDYQQRAVDAIWTAVRTGCNAPLAVLPTGSGKSPVVGRLVIDAVHRWKGKALVLVHTKELIEQLSDTIRRMWPNKYPPLGIMSAGLGSVQVEDITVAGIQTAFRRGMQIGRRDIVIIDECQMIPNAGDGMYRTLINDLKLINPNIKIIGLTATPYRTTTGRIDGDDGLFERTVIDVPIPELIEQGYLSRITGKNGGNPDLTQVNKRGGEYIQSELEAVMTDENRVQASCEEIKRYIPGRQGVIVFCSGSHHCAMVAAALRSLDITCEVVTADTPPRERDQYIRAMKTRELKCLVNTNILSIGFDAPHIDLIVMLRPTESPGLFYQQAGRGFRICEGKDSCTILDMAGNMERHGPIVTLNQRLQTTDGKAEKGESPGKTCPACAEIVAASALTCDKCGHEFPPREIVKHKTKAADGDPLMGMPTWRDVGSCKYSVWDGKNGKPDTLRVDYYAPNITGVFGWMSKHIASEWVCVQHDGYAGGKAMAWLAARCPFPVVGRQMIADGETIDLTPEALSDPDISRYFATPSRISVERDGKFTKITDCEFEEKNDNLPF